MIKIDNTKVTIFIYQIQKLKYQKLYYISIYKINLSHKLMTMIVKKFLKIQFPGPIGVTMNI